MMKDLIEALVEVLSFLAVLALLVFTPIGWSMMILYAMVRAIEVVAGHKE